MPAHDSDELIKSRCMRPYASRTPGLN